MGLITLLGLVTTSASTYMFLYSHRLYLVVARWLAVSGHIASSVLAVKPAGFRRPIGA